MVNTCYLKFGIENNHFVIKVSDGREILRRIDLDDNSVEQIRNLSNLYQHIVAMHSFSEDDRRFLRATKLLGKQLYDLVFVDLEDILSHYSSLFIEYDIFLLPLELAFDGTQFIGIRYAVGNWVNDFGSLPAAKSDKLLKKEWNINTNILFVGDKDEQILKNLYSEWNHLKCERITNIWTDSLIQRLKSNDCSIIHFSGHGWSNNVSSKESFLVLDQAILGRSKHAVLRIADFKNTKLTQPLIFLNACQSGQMSENNIAFTEFVNAFLKSGASSCITTLWSVSNEDASDFASAFYKYLFNGNTIGQALRLARLKYWTEKEDILAGLSYILFGDPTRNVQPTNKTHYRSNIR